MKKHYLILGLCIALISNVARGALSGTYTINPSSSASSTNYQNFASAVSDLISGTRSDGGTANGSGVSGAVLFNVSAGTYTTQFEITAITGASATNTITFKGAGISSTTIQYSSSTSYADGYTVRITNASFIYFDF